MNENQVIVEAPVEVVSNQNEGVVVETPEIEN